MASLYGTCAWLLRKSNASNLSFLIALTFLAITQELNFTPIGVYFISLFFLLLVAYTFGPLPERLSDEQKGPIMESLGKVLSNFYRGLPFYFIVFVLVIEADQMSQTWLGEEMSIPTILAVFMGAIVITDLFRENIYKNK